MYPYRVNLDQINCFNDICHYKCATCGETGSNCLSCAGNRVNPPGCTCPSGYYDILEDFCV